MVVPFGKLAMEPGSRAHRPEQEKKIWTTKTWTAVQRVRGRVGTGKHENLEIGKRMHEDLKALISDNHAFQPEFFQPRVRLRHGWFWELQEKKTKTSYVPSNASKPTNIKKQTKQIPNENDCRLPPKISRRYLAISLYVSLNCETLKDCLDR